MDTKPALFSPYSYCMDDSVGYLLARSRSTIARALDEVLVHEGITYAQGGIFMLLQSGKCTSAADLAREMYIDSAAMKRMVDRLIAGGFIQRTLSAHDKRQYTLSLSSAGTELAQRLPGMYAQVMDQCFSSFSPEEVSFLKFLLKKILANNP